MYNMKGAYFILLSALFIAFLSITLIKYSHIAFLGNSYHDPITQISTNFLLGIFDIDTYHHHHHQKPQVQSVCDDFLPPDFSPSGGENGSTIICVDRNGCCNFTTVRSAIDAVGTLQQKRTIIWINKGIYFEKITVPRIKPNITLLGQGMERTAIVWNDTANSSHGTFYSASVSVFASNFIATNISFMNVAPIANPGDVGGQAVAFRIAGDQAAFWGCGFFSGQDTLHDDRGRHYFKDCFIQGSIDFIFGNGRNFYKNCQLNSVANPVPSGAKLITGAISAQARSTRDENTGFSFVNCSIGGRGRTWLGRAWRPFSTVIFAYTFMSEIISPDGWNDWNDPSRDQTIFYGEYQCSGSGANTTSRVSYVHILNDSQAAPFLNISYIDGQQWLQPFTN
ncbi:probable pectinesterase 8 [Amborella trichopoda]|uniref:probable pectinesterase 8 n=1 Tax=Amborella trichopoda TaxID=13333 RepID=UPI0009BCFC32|nr:probable pectinesterase 8 [Amborella trichopoda]|eukprot:XP_020517865.1 probable pectinesterase 8 [Amborella trichopoda]